MQKKLMRTQSIIFIIYSVLVFSSFLYALGFMTDFKVLFQQVGKIGKFHEDILQPFNREIFRTSLITVIGFVILLSLEIRTKIADYFALIILYILALFNIIRAIKFIKELKELSTEYLNLDFSQLLLASNATYNVTTRTFDFGINLYAMLSLFSLLLIVIASINTFMYIRMTRREANE